MQYKETLKLLTKTLYLFICCETNFAYLMHVNKPAKTLEFLRTKYLNL